MFITTVRHFSITRFFHVSPFVSANLLFKHFLTQLHYLVGHPPYVSFPPSEPETSIIFQTESFSDPGPNHSPTTPDQGELKFNCNFTTSINNSFEIKYDLKMYKNGIDVSCYGEGGGEGIELSDDHNGTVTVRCTADGIVGGVCIEPRGV